jgi:predicted MFS family arabinose efflux permease
MINLIFDNSYPIQLVRSITGDTAVGLGVGILLLWHSLGAAAGSSLGGSIYDATGSYNDALLVCLSLCLAASVACLSMGLPICIKGDEKFKGHVESDISQ